MPLSADSVRLHLDYSSWASQRLLDAAAKLSEEELARDFKTSDKSVAGTLAHAFAADRIWLERIQGDVRSTFISDADRHLPTLSHEWPALAKRWKDWAANLSDRDLLEVKTYKTLNGDPYETPLWQIVLHVVNHATHHRGQVSGFIRAMGYAPPQLDMIAYYRTLA